MKKRISNVFQEGFFALQEAEIADARLDAWYLLEWVTGISRASYLAHPEIEVEPEQEEKYKAAIKKRAARIPLQHITGVQEFMGLTFQVNEHVLIPRQDTEILVETGLSLVEDGDRILDMCTGSGCILISLETLCKTSSHSFTGVDISKKALEMASLNARLHNSKARFIESDLFDRVEGLYDLILSNPPYIKTSVIEQLEEEVRGHDPLLALDGREDGLYFYRRIICESRNYLEDGGWLLFEIGHDQRGDVSELLKEAGFVEIIEKKDLAGLDRVVGGRYIKR